MSSRLELTDNQHCFACGPQNPTGLQLCFAVSNGRARAEVTADARFQAYVGIVHGGIVATLLDEAMAYAAISLGRWTVTAEMTVRYLKPARIGERLILTGEVIRNTSRLAECTAELCTEAGERIAVARGKLLKGEPVPATQTTCRGVAP
ncbi:MAG: PaaI family thioesterase [Armatimonadetes bacterium]|nr:PaaI family thioesterase [Armatimonadota bacterium]